MDPKPRSSEADRKSIEKKRRIEMKSLYSGLNSLVPHQSSREARSRPGQLELATNYIKKLQLNMEKLKRRKECLLGTSSANLSGTMFAGSIGSREINLPRIDVRIMGSALEVVLILSKNRQFMLSEIIGMLHREGAEVISANFSVLDDAFFHTMHCKVDYGEFLQDHAAARILDRLRNCNIW